MIDTIKIREIGDVKMCRRILKEQTTSNPKGIPFYKISTFGGVAENYIPRDVYEDYRQKYAFPDKGAILISAAGTIGRLVIYHGEDAYFQDSNIVWVDNDESRVTNQYLYYALKLSNWKTTDGSTIKRLYNDNILDLDIPYTGKDRQAKITSILSTIDDKISINSNIIKTSEKLMREIYDYWFVQFDFPDENGRPYKSSGGEMVYNETLKREIPKGWSVQNLLQNDLCSDIKPGIEKFCNKKAYYATANVTNSDMDSNSEIDYESRESRANMQPIPNSIWFAKMKNSIKHITVLPTSDDLINDAIFSTGFFGLKTSRNSLPYIRGFIYSGYFEKVKDLNSHGATMEAISNDGVKNIKLLIPNDDLLEKYANITSDILENIDTLRRENSQLAYLRDWLLPMLMNGQVKVED